MSLGSCTSDDENVDRMSVRFVADPVSVPEARRITLATLTQWRLEQLGDDVSLVVTELCTNAALHSDGRFLDLLLERRGQTVRIAVSDDGCVPAAAVVRRPLALLPKSAAPLPLENAATTGRGLAIVEILSDSWGVTETAGGKRVWAELSVAGCAEPRPAFPRDREHDVAVAAPGTAADQLPAGWHLVRLLDCPVQLSLRQDDHIDELIRELQLIDGRREEHGPPGELAQLIENLLGRHAHARHLGRQVAQDAAAAGAQVITIDMPMAAAGAVDVQRLHEAVRAADTLCEQRRLLTLTSPPELRRLRAWLAAEIHDQITEGRQPRPFA